MTEEGFKRKLTAILSADVEGYSRLMGEDEAGTVQALKNHREMMTSMIQQHRGRVIDTPGDNLLAEFASVVDAVQCAVEIQEVLRARNAEVPDNRKMLFRIGINLGDVIEDGDRIYGDGVNIAARVEGLAEGGGICISGTVYEHIMNKLALGYDYMGEHTVKNIAKPIQVYRVPMEPSAADSMVSREKNAAETPALELPEKPSIAVLPFVNMSGEPDQEFFSDGITEEIITALSKVPRILVIARNSTFTYKGKAVDVKQVRREMAVRYVLEGSVRKSGNRVRITAQLIDTGTGFHLWAERFDRNLKEIFALQDEITLRILVAIQVKLTEGEQARLREKHSKNIEVYLKLLEGRECFLLSSREGNVQARLIFEEVLVREPENVMALVGLAYTHLMDIVCGWTVSAGKAIEQAEKLVKNTLALDDTYPPSHAAMCMIHLWKRQHDLAIAAGERAIALNPNSSDAHFQLAIALVFSGRPEEAIALMRKTLRLNPLPPDRYLITLAHAYRYTGRYEKAVELCERVLKHNPDDLLARVGLAGAYSMAGREEEARAAAAEVQRLYPNFSLLSYTRRLPYKNPADTDRYVESLRKAGLE